MLFYFSKILEGDGERLKKWEENIKIGEFKTHGHAKKLRKISSEEEKYNNRTNLKKNCLS